MEGGAIFDHYDENGYGMKSMIWMALEPIDLSEVGSNFTTEFLWDNISGQFWLEYFKRGIVVKVIGLDRSSGDDSDEKLVMGFAGNGVNGKVEAIEAFLIIIF